MQKAKNTTPLIACRREAYKEEAPYDSACKDKKESSTISHIKTMVPKAPISHIKTTMVPKAPISHIKTTMVPKAPISHIKTTMVPKATSGKTSEMGQSMHGLSQAPKCYFELISVYPQQGAILCSHLFPNYK